MATIQPFKPIRPNPSCAGQLVFAAPEENLYALKTMLESGARTRPETAEDQSAAYTRILLNLQSLLAQKCLWQEQQPAIYVYEIIHKTYRQTGVWAVTALEDYTNGTIKTHELTLADSVRRQKNYRENTGIEGSPILLTYPPDIAVNRIIADTRVHGHEIIMGNEEAQHKLWKIEDEATIAQLVTAFAKIRTSYLADGHHRLDSAAKLAEEQKSKGLRVYDTLSSLYIATDQLRILEYNRVFLPVQKIDRGWLFSQLIKNFYMQESWNNKPVRPSQRLRMGMHIEREWYHLLPKPHACNSTNISGGLDAAILQQELLAPVFGVTDAGTDTRLTCIGGAGAMDELLAFIAEHPRVVAFTLCPLTVPQLTGVADAGEILPPKSTWIDPKVPYGLLMHKH